MADQHHFWSKAAASYEQEFVDPFRADVKSPLKIVLKKLAAKGAKVVGDLGCGIGPLLPFLSEAFASVIAVDFAPGMLERARRRCADKANITYLERSLTDLVSMAGSLDVAISVNSLVMPTVAEQEDALRQIRATLKPDGHFVGILPAMDGVHYQTMLLLDRALDRGQPLDAAKKNAAHLNDHALYDFAFGNFRFQGLDQHFWQPFEIRYRFARAGLTLIRKKKVHLSWSQFGGQNSLKQYPPPWDWFFVAKPAAAVSGE
jgi:SAM-dependent methyltransferase